MTEPDEPTLEQVYAEAKADGVFFVEYQSFPAAAGDLRDLTWLANEYDETPEQLLADLTVGFAGAVVDLCCLGTVKPDDDHTRAEACQSAWDRLKERREEGAWPRLRAVREELGMPVSDDPKPLGTF